MEEMLQLTPSRSSARSSARDILGSSMGEASVDDLDFSLEDEGWVLSNYKFLGSCLITIESLIKCMFQHPDANFLNFGIII